LHHRSHKNLRCGKIFKASVTFSLAILFLCQVRTVWLTQIVSYVWESILGQFTRSEREEKLKYLIWAACFLCARNF
jgi:hypothetical protein